MKKRSVALFLAIVMLFSIFPFGAFAEANNEKGSEEIMICGSFEERIAHIREICESAREEIEQYKAKHPHIDEALLMEYIAKVVEWATQKLTVDIPSLPMDLSEEEINGISNMGDSTVFGYCLDTLNDKGEVVSLQWGSDDTLETGYPFKASYGYGQTSFQAYPAYLKAHFGMSDAFTVKPLDDLKAVEEACGTKHQFFDFYSQPRLDPNDNAKLYSGVTRTKAAGSEREIFPLAAAGITSGELRAVLEEDYPGSPNLYAQYISTPKLASFGFSAENNREEICSAIKESDIITIAIGNNDLNAALVAFTPYFEGMGDPNVYLNWEQFSDCSVQTIRNAIESMTRFFNEIFPGNQASNDFMRALAEMMLYAFAVYHENLPTIVEDVHELNPDAKILLMGIYNPFTEIHYQKSADMPKIPLCGFVDAIISWLNAVMINSIEGKRDYCGYVDCTGIDILDTYGTISHNINDYDFNISDYLMELMFDNQVQSIHESKEGHHQLYTRIMEALNLGHHAHHLECVVEQEPTCDKEGKAAYVCNESLCEFNDVDCDDTGCGEHFVDQWGQQEGDMVLAKTDHHFGEWTKVDEKTHQRVCADCGKVETVEHVLENDECRMCGYSRLTGNTHTGINNNEMVFVWFIVGLLIIASCGVVLVYRRRHQ